MTPAKKLKEIREKIERLSQAEFAKKYNAKLNSIRFIEQGRQDIPDDLALILEKEYKIPFKWWKTGEGPMYIPKEEYLAATGTCSKPHLRVIKSGQVTKTEIVGNIDLAQREIDTIDDEKLKEIAKRLGRSITVEYVENDKKEKTCEVLPDGSMVEAQHSGNINRPDNSLDNAIGQYLTKFEAEQLIKALKNNKAFLFIFIEKLNSNPQATKRVLLNFGK